jgi:hypothetical protein
LVVEQEGYGVREHLAHQPAHQVPQITCPHPLYGVALGELAKNGVYPVAKRLSRVLLLGAGSRFLEEYGARSSTPIVTSSSFVLGEW